MKKVRGRLEEAEARTLGLRGRGSRQRRKALAQLRDDLSNFGGARPGLRGEHIRLDLARVGPERLRPGPAGRCLAGLPAAADQHSRSLSSRASDDLLGQPALPDARLTLDQEQPAAPGEGIVETRPELGELRSPADEHTQATFLLLGRAPVELGILAEDRFVEVAQFAPGLDAELLHQKLTPGAVRLERLGLATRAVEREHQLCAQPPRRVLRDQPLKLADDIGMPAESEVGLDSLLECAQPRLFKPGDLRLGERLVREIRERRTAPQGERLAQQHRGRRRLRPLRVRYQPFEASEVDLLRIDVQRVAGRTRDDQPCVIAARSVRLEHLAQARYGHRQRLGPSS